MNIQELQAELGYDIVIAETTDDEQEFLDMSDNDFDPDYSNLDDSELAFMNDLDNGLVDDEDDDDEDDEVFNNLCADVNRAVVTLTARGPRDPQEILDRYQRDMVWVAENVFTARVIEQCCERLGRNYTRIGNIYLVV